MNARKYFQLMMVVLGWFAVVVQFVVMIINRKTDVSETIIRFLSYFTILTNVLTVVYFTNQFFGRKDKLTAYFSRSSVQTAIAVYITVVCIVANTVLRGLLDLQGLDWILDRMLHLIIPILTIVYWFRWTNGKSLKWADLFTWMIYPGLYCIFVIWRGSQSGFYPYPFLNIIKLGYQAVAINCAGVMLVFVLTSVLFIWIGQRKSHRDIYLV